MSKLNKLQNDIDSLAKKLQKKHNLSGLSIYTHPANSTRCVGLFAGDKKLILKDLNTLIHEVVEIQNFKKLSAAELNLHPEIWELLKGHSSCLDVFYKAHALSKLED
jgi:hypothetical protein